MNSNQKGKAGERELARELQKYGYDCHRGQQFKGGSDSPDVIGLPGIHIECKRVENLNLGKAYEQAVTDARGQAIPAVFHRKNRKPWMVTISLEHWMEMYKLWQKEQD